MCDFFEVTAASGEGNGESFNRLPVAPHELILAEAGYCSIAGIEYVQRQNADVLVRVNPHSLVAYSPHGRRICLLSRLRTVSKVAQTGEWRLSCMVETPRLQAGWARYERAAMRFNKRTAACSAERVGSKMAARPGRLEFANYVLVFTTRPRSSASEVLIRTSISFI